MRHGAGGEGGTGAAAYEEQQRPKASERKRALAWGTERYTLLNR